MLANWNRRGTELDGNFVSPESTPIDFQDLTALLAAWTGSGPAAAPQAAVGSDPLQPVERDRMNPVTTSEDRIDPVNTSTSEPASDAYFDRLGRREARHHRTGSALRRLQSTAVDRAIETTDEAAPRRVRAARRK